MRNTLQSILSFLHDDVLPAGAVILRAPDDKWAFAAGNPELWRISTGNEMDAHIPGQFFTPIQIDYWRNDGDIFSGAQTCTTTLKTLGFDVNPLAIRRVPRYNWDNPSAPVFINWMRLTLASGQSWAKQPSQEPDVRLLRYVLSLDLEYSKYY